MTQSFPLFRRSFIAGAGGLLAAGHARAQAPAAPGGDTQPMIDVEGAQTNPIHIAITNFGSSASAAEIVSVISSDLRNSGLFAPIDQAAFIAGDAGPLPNFQNWKAIGAQALVTGSVTDAGDQVRVEFRLWEVLTGQQLQGTAYTSPNKRRIAHIIADVIYEKMLGEKGYFDTRIVYVAVTGPRGRQTKRLAIMDQDAANQRMLTNGEWLVLTPRFNPVRDEIAFMSYANNRPRVYLFDLSTGRQTTLGEFEGMSFAPRFSPDGGSCILSVTRGGGSDIFVVDVASRAPRQLTRSGSIDTSPCYSPDGTQIVFNSDRDGDQQLYVMGSGGGSAKRISFGHGWYATPVWSPRGRRHAPRWHRRAYPVRKLFRGRPHLRAQWPGAHVLAGNPLARRLRPRLFLAPGLDRHHRLQRAPNSHQHRRVGPGMVPFECLNTYGESRRGGHPTAIFCASVLTAQKAAPRRCSKIPAGRPQAGPLTHHADFPAGGRKAYPCIAKSYRRGAKVTVQLNCCPSATCSLDRAGKRAKSPGAAATIR
jgi:TolB protein